MILLGRTGASGLRSGTRSPVGTSSPKGWADSSATERRSPSPSTTPNRGLPSTLNRAIRTGRTLPTGRRPIRLGETARRATRRLVPRSGRAGQPGHGDPPVDGRQRRRAAGARRRVLPTAGGLRAGAAGGGPAGVHGLAGRRRRGAAPRGQ